MVLTRTAPDGTVISIDTERRPVTEDAYCPARTGEEDESLRYECTLPLAGHGSWHAADTGIEIVFIWNDDGESVGV